MMLGILCIFSLAACGRGSDADSTEAEATETTETIQVSVAEEDGPLLKDMTREDLNALTAEEIQELVEAQLPNYRDIFIIDEDREMSEDDWLLLRDLLVYQMYGAEETTEDTTSQSSVSSSVLSSEDDPDRIYFAPTVDEINAMSTQEFAEYLNSMCAYYNTGTDIDFTTLDENTIEERRAALIESIESSLK
jgi:hypothetical protein